MRRLQSSVALALAVNTVLVAACTGDTAAGPDRVNEAIEYALADAITLGEGVLSDTLVAVVTSVGPEPETVSGLGIEVPLRTYSPADDVVAIGSGWPLGSPGVTAAYIGEIANTGMLAFVVPRRDPSTDAALLSTVLRLPHGAGGYEMTFDGTEAIPTVQLVDEIQPGVIIVAFLPPGAAIVVAHTHDGREFWQRPVGGTAFIALPDASVGRPFAVWVLDSRGRQLPEGNGHAENVRGGEYETP